MANIAFYTDGGNYEHPQSEEECVDLASLLLESGPIAIDVETISLDERTPIGVSIAPDSNCAFYYPLFPDISPYIPWKILRDPNRIKILHNCMFDLDVLDDISPHNIFDTCLVASWVGLPWALDDIAPGLGMYDKMSISEILPKGKTMLDIPEELVARKCCQDTIATYRLWEQIKGDVSEEYLDWDMRLIPVLLKMNQRGVKIDQDLLLKFKSKYEQVAESMRTICDGIGFSPGSNKQISYVLAHRGNFLPLTDSGKNLKTDAATLRNLEDPLAGVILNYKEAQSMLSKGINKIMGHDRAYTKYGLLSQTGRTTSSGARLPGHINIQQQFSKDYRREIRNVFLPDSGTWTDGDDSQIELRVIAYMSGDPTLLHIFQNYDQWLIDGVKRPKTSEEDIHIFTSEICGTTRKVAKNINYAFSYGGSDHTISTYANIPLDLARMFRARLVDYMPTAMRWMEDMQQVGVRDGVVESLYGRKYYVGDVAKDLFECMRLAVNYPVQGTASEIFKRQLVKVGEAGHDVAIEVHDEFVIDGKVPVDPALEWIAPFKTPLEVRYLDRWE